MLARRIMGDGGKAVEKGSASPQTIGLLSNLVVSLPLICISVGRGSAVTI